MNFDSIIEPFVKADDLMTIEDVNTTLLDIRSCPGEVVRIFLSGRKRGTAVDKGEESILAVEIGQEGDGGAR